MKFSRIFGAALATAVSVLPVAAHAEYSSHFSDIKLPGGLPAAKHEAETGPSHMELSIVPHNEYDHGHTSYIWNDADLNQVLCTIPYNGDLKKASCSVHYDYDSARYAHFTAKKHKADAPSTPSKPATIFDERPTQKEL